MQYVWLTNLHDPRIRPFEVMLNSNLEFDLDDDVWQQWLSYQAIGEPKPIDGSSIEQLKAQGYVGVYKRV